MTTQPAWWEGPRGEWYVVVQVALFMLVAFGPPSFAGLPLWVSPYGEIALVCGYILLAAGILFVVSGLWELRAQITPLPYPRDNSKFIETGPYSLVRHPIYSGGILMAFGWALMIHGWLTLVYALLLFLFFDFKSRREEAWLSERFSGYGDYQTRVHRLIPFLY